MTRNATDIPPTTPELIDGEEVADVLRCSKRHVLRLAQRGQMPPPVRLGALLRWSRGALDDWIAAGCPAVRQHDSDTNEKGGRPR